MDDQSRLTINKSLAGMQFRRDPEIDMTAIRVGKNRLARRKDPQLSELKQAILSQRKFASRAPAVLPDAIKMDEDSLSTDPSTRPNIGPYVDHLASEKLDDLTFKVLKELSRLQARGSQQPLEKRYKYKKFVAGIREVQRALIRGDLKGIIVATNLEPEIDALSTLIMDLKRDAEQKEVPFVIALNKRRIGKALNKSMKQSVIGITNLEGVFSDWRSILEEVSNLRAQFTGRNTIASSSSS